MIQRPDTNNYKNGKNNPCAASIFNETHVFRKEYSFLIYTEKRKEEKNLNSNNHLVDTTQNSIKSTLLRLIIEPKLRNFRESPTTQPPPPPFSITTPSFYETSW